MNNVDDSIDVEQSHSGISRRDMIKASVIAGGLVWTAPLLLSGTAAAAPADCCPAGFAVVAVKITGGSGNAVNCGVDCLDHDIFGANVACCRPLAEALVDVVSFDNAGAVVNVTSPSTIVAASAKFVTRGCFVTECNSSGGFTGGGGRVAVSGQTVTVTRFPGDGNLQVVEIAVCVRTAISPFCQN